MLLFLSSVEYLPVERRLFKVQLRWHICMHSDLPYFGFGNNPRLKQKIKRKEHQNK